MLEPPGSEALQTILRYTQVRGTTVIDRFDELDFLYFYRVSECCPQYLLLSSCDTIHIQSHNRDTYYRIYLLCRLLYYITLHILYYITVIL